MDQEIFGFLIKVRNLEPVTWRKVLIPRTYSFSRLHDIVQLCFGWTNIFDHKFECLLGNLKTTIMPLHGIDYGEDAKEELTVTLQEVFLNVGAKGIPIS